MNEHKLKEIYAEIKSDLSLQYDLNREQEKVIVDLLSKNNICAVLPTGSGKSTLFSIMPMIHDKVSIIIVFCHMYMYVT